MFWSCLIHKLFMRILDVEIWEKVRGKRKNSQSGSRKYCERPRAKLELANYLFMEKKKKGNEKLRGMCHAHGCGPYPMSSLNIWHMDENSSHGHLENSRKWEKEKERRWRTQKKEHISAKSWGFFPHEILPQKYFSSCILTNSRVLYNVV